MIGRSVMAAENNKKDDLEQKCYSFEVQSDTVERASKVLKPGIMYKIFEKTLDFM